MSQIIHLDASQHSIKSVSIFSSSKAEITRNFSVNLTEGQNEVKITCLPSSIDTDSARVTGLGDAVLFDVVCIVSGDKSPSLSRPSNALRKLEHRKTQLESEKGIRRHEADMLTQFGYTLNAEYNVVDNAEALLGKFVERAKSILRDASKIDEDISEIEDEIVELKHKEEEKRKRASTYGQVSAIILAKRAGTIEMSLTYMVSGASWNPTYDLRASTKGGKLPSTVTLHYRAAIAQNTGEDWTNASLSLSTAQPGRFTHLPTLRSLRVVPAVSPSLFNPNNNASSPGHFQTNNVFGQPHHQQQQQSSTSLFGASGGPQAYSIPTGGAFGVGGAGGAFGSQVFGPQPSTAINKGSTFGTFAAGSSPSSFGEGQGRLFGTGGLFGTKPAATTSNENAFGTSSAGSAKPSMSTFSVTPSKGQASEKNPEAAARAALGTDNNTTTARTTATDTNSAQKQESEQNQTDDSWTTVDTSSGSEIQDLATGLANTGLWGSTTTSVTESAVSSTFRIDGTCSIPSDNASHKVIIAVLPFEANVHHVAVPRSTPVTFLQCSVTNSSEYMLLRGPVNVYMDESPVSKTTISDVNPEETFTCTLGPDPSLRIKLIRLPRTVTTTSTAFTAQTTSASYKSRIKVQNTHSFPVHELILRDSLPLPPTDSMQNSQIRVVLKEPRRLSEVAVGALVDIKNGLFSSSKVRWENPIGDKEGKFEWVLNIGAGEEVQVESEYEVLAPSYYKWTMQESLF